MKIELYTKNITRVDMPSNSSKHGRISSITKTKIGRIISSAVPQQGEIIHYKGVNYEVYTVIRMAVESEIFEEYFVLEVGVYNTNRVKSWGSNYWDEEIPLCIDIED